MTDSTTTVVTPARYEQGLTYTQFLARATVNLDRFAHYYEIAQLPEWQRESLREIRRLLSTALEAA